MEKYADILGEVLFTEDTIKTKVAQLGARITRDYRGRDLVVVGILKGATVFLSDLIRNIDLPLRLDYSELITYGDEMNSQGEVILAKDVRKNIRGRHVLVVEDIVDTGLTISFLSEHLGIRQPASLEICTLLHKPSRLRVRIPLRYVCFEIEDCFVVGYGLDFAGLYRNVPYIARLNEDVIAKMGDNAHREYGVRL